MEIAAVLVIGLLAGALGGMFGVGGGLIFVPTLVLFVDLGQVDSEATSLLAILPVVIAGTWRQHLYGNVRWRTAAIIGLTAIAGVELGVLTAKALPELTLRRLFAALALVVAAQLAWRAHRSATHESRPTRGRSRRTPPPSTRPEAAKGDDAPPAGDRSRP